MTQSAAQNTEDCTAEVFIKTLTEEQRASRQGPADLHVVDLHVLAGNVLHGNFLCDLLTRSRTHDWGYQETFALFHVAPGLQMLFKATHKAIKTLGLVLYLHLKAGFALVHTISALASRPQVSKTLHCERWGAVSVPWHLKVQVAVI